MNGVEHAHAIPLDTAQVIVLAGGGLLCNNEAGYRFLARLRLLPGR